MKGFYQDIFCQSSSLNGKPELSMNESEEEGSDISGEVLISLLFIFGIYKIVNALLAEYNMILTKRCAIHFTYHEMFQYRIDHYFSTCKLAKPTLLLSATFVLIVTGASLLTIVSGNSVSTSTWMTWTYVADPGTHADAEGTAVRFVSFCITIGGMLIFALMIGIISEAINEKVDGLKKGKSRVIEADHTLILGWSDKSLAIIEQIALANESEGGGCIVVLANDDKEEMERMLQLALGSPTHSLSLLGTNVVFRSGNPLLEHELLKVSVAMARAIIVLSIPHVDSDEADSIILRQVLAIKAIEKVSCHVVVEMQDIDNSNLVQLVHLSNTEVVVTHDIIGRLMIQCARQPGLAYFLESLLGFEGSEFYLNSWKELFGQTFLQITCRFDDAVVVGVKLANGEVCINPENDYVIQEGDKILCLAEDNDTYSVNEDGHNLSEDKVPTISVVKRNNEKLLFCGWRRDMADMITQLDLYVEKGSELWLFNTVLSQERMALLKDKDNKDELKTKNLTIKNVVGNPIVRRNLRRLHAVDEYGKRTGESITLDEFRSILILSDGDAPNMESSDSRSLASSLIIQDLQRELIAEKNENNKSSLLNKTDERCNTVSEILETRTRSLLQVAGCKGYVMSNYIISLWLAQVAEDRDINVVLGELLSAEGCETYIRDISYYLDLKKKKKQSFWDVALLARQRREVAVGYKPKEMNWPQALRYIINPSNKASPRKWKEGDSVLVFAFD